MEARIKFIKQENIKVKFQNYINHDKNLLTLNMINYLKKNINLNVNNKKPEIIHLEPEINNKEETLVLNDYLTKYAFHRKWQKLAVVHKKMKIKEYISTKLPIKISKNEQEKIIEQLYDLVDQKKLNKKGTVNYDVTYATITNISALKVNDDKKYEINS
jgi:hypothetical protein